MSLQNIALKRQGAPPPAERTSALLERLDPLPADRYGILGVEARLRSDSEAVRGFFAHAYRHFPSQGGEPDLELGAVFRPAGAGAPFVLAGDRWATLAGSASPENRAFLFLLEALMDRVDSAVLLHGAALSCEGRGVILAGPAMAGKSTLALELMALGHAFLSDDAAPIERETGLLLPFPRAIGMRKAAGTTASRGLPASSVLELPHKLLLDPAALGARLPAAPCPPRLLFYLESAPAQPEGDAADRVFEIALAAGSGRFGEELRGLGAEAIERADDRPFSTLVARFRAGSHPVAGLTSLWRQNRDSVLYIEEIRPPAERSDGPPALKRVGAATLLSSLARDVLNRGEEGRLMAALGGRLASLIIELGRLLRAVECYRVTSGSPQSTAAAIDRVARGKEQAP